MNEAHKDHPIRIVPFAGRVHVEFGGETIAESVSALAMHEAQYPVVYYVPREDVEMSRLVPSDRRTHCPHKGKASHFSIKDAGAAGEDIAWSYENPIDGVRQIAGFLAFYANRVEISAEPPEVRLAFGVKAGPRVKKNYFLRS